MIVSTKGYKEKQIFENMKDKFSERYKSSKNKQGVSGIKIR